MASHLTPWYLQRSGSRRRSSLLLEKLSVAPVAVFSTLRKQRSSQTNLVRVRRDDNAATADIGATASDEIDNAAIAAHASGTTGRTSIWYDQSGNGLNLSGSGSTIPAIYTGGAVVVLNTKTAHASGGTTRLARADGFGLGGDISLTMVSAWKASAANTVPLIAGHDATGRAFGFYYDTAGNMYISTVGQGNRFTLANGADNPNYYTIARQAGQDTISGTMRQNGAALAQNSATGAGAFNYLNVEASWGANFGGLLPCPLTGNFWIIFDQILSAGDLALCEAEAALHVA